MAYVNYNPNPVGARVCDANVRVISKVLDMGWQSAYLTLTMNGFSMGDMPSSDSVLGATLRQHGFFRKSIPDTRQDYTAADFCLDHPEGVFVLGFGKHNVAVVDGDIYDSWDCSTEIPQYYWQKGEK